MSAEKPICPDCGTQLARDAPKGFCPKCLFARAQLGGLLLDPADSQLLSVPDAAEAPDSALRSSARFGDYELLEEIAHGGMGVVWRARQVSLHRVVAVKMILHGPLASGEYVERFKAEAAAAAHLQHPNIVAIHEVGEQEGRHFFSMDYVEGKNLAELVREGPLPAKRAAGYVKAIAAAIHYAHQRHILHRDLKPSNVLIDAFDQPRITDFGLAKRLASTQDPRGAPERASAAAAGLQTQDLTSTGQVLGSPNFMPPEQAAGRHNELGPASDVYALGAILYHLVTGRPPFVAETVAGTLRLVAETDPVSPRLLTPSLARDLNTICLKCLEKSPVKRYQTAQALAEELGRFLRDEPIQARPVNRLEKLWRWRRRKPLVAGLSAALVLCFVLGFGSVLWQWSRAARARKQAEASEKSARRQASKSEQVAQFLQDMLTGVGPSVALGRDTVLLREILDKTSERVGKGLTNQPEVEAELRNTLGEVYAALGQDEKAEEMKRRALALQKQVLGNESKEIAATLNNLALVLNSQGKAAEAESVQREALAMQRRIYGNEHPDVATSLNNLALVLSVQDRLAEAESVQREALAMQRKLLGNEARNVGLGIINLAVVLQREGKLAESEALHREGLALVRKMFGREHPDVALALATLGAVLEQEGKLTEAESVGSEALALARKLWNNEHRNVANSLQILARVQEKQGKLVEAETQYREALAICRKTSGDLHFRVANLLDSLVQVLLSQQRYEQAEQICNDLLIPANCNQPASAALLHSRGVCRVRGGRWTEALADFVRASDWQPDNPYLLHSLVLLLIQTGDLESYRRRCQHILVSFGGTNDPTIANLMAKDCLILPVSDVDLGVAARLAETAVTLGKDSPDLAWLQLTKGLAEYRQGQFASAVEWIQKVLEKAGDTPPRDVQASALLAMSCWRLQREDQSRSALASGLAIERARVSAPDSGDLGNDWRAWITAHALLCEAQALILSPGE